MRKLYWKIFLSFWLATTLIIISTAWITSRIANQSSIPLREKIFINSYANAAVSTFESGKKKALLHWLTHLSLSRHMRFFLLTSKGDILGRANIPPIVKKIRTRFLNQTLPEGIFKIKNVIISHEILTLSQHTYRLVVITRTPISHLTRITFAGLSLQLSLAIVISGLICYLLSLYLTLPLRSLRAAAQSLAYGKLDTRVKETLKHRHDEIAELGHDFDHMAEQLENLIRAKERLLQDISHELRSPLARLQVATEIARQKTAGKANTEFERIDTETQRLNELIGEILSLAKLNVPKNQLVMEDISLKDLLLSIIQDANFEFGEKHKRVFFKLSEDILLNVDKKLIHRAIENIIRNAVRYSGEAGRVELSLYKENSYAVICVKDNGPGVPKQHREKIFIPFYRVDTSREKNTGGYGLGLAIAQKAIHLHKGHIKAKDNELGGLSIFVYLPLTNEIALS